MSADARTKDFVAYFHEEYVAVFYRGAGEPELGTFNSDMIAQLQSITDRWRAAHPARVKISGEDHEQEYRDALAEHDRALAEVERTQRMVDRARTAVARTLPARNGHE